MAINKFFHTVLSGWVLGAVFVIGVSCWFLLKKSNTEVARESIRIASWVGLAGIVLTMWTGDGSAVQVAQKQPMKLAAMEGLYDGHHGQSLVAFGIVNPRKTLDNDEPALLAEIAIPNGLALLANHDPLSFVPGINDIIDGVSYDNSGKPIDTVSYAERIARGKASHEALRLYDEAKAKGDKPAMAEAEKAFMADFPYFGYGYLDSPAEAVPPVALTFYMFRVMVIGGGYLLLLFVVMLMLSYRKPEALSNKWAILFGLISIPIVWLVSEAGWITAEVGRQPWTIEGLLPCRAAISAISSGSVQLTFWIFVVLFTCLLAADISIMCREIAKATRRDILYGPEKTGK